MCYNSGNMEFVKHTRYRSLYDTILKDALDLQSRLKYKLQIYQIKIKNRLNITFLGFEY